MVCPDCGEDLRHDGPFYGGILTIGDDKHIGDNFECEGCGEWWHTFTDDDENTLIKGCENSISLL